MKLQWLKHKIEFIIFLDYCSKSFLRSSEKFWFSLTKILRNIKTAKKKKKENERKFIWIFFFLDLISYFVISTFLIASKQLFEFENSQIVPFNDCRLSFEDVHSLMFSSKITGNYHQKKVVAGIENPHCIWCKWITNKILRGHKLLSSSSSCRAASTDIPDPLLPLLPIVHRFWQVFRATSRILTELLNVCSSWSSCFCPAICRDP